MALLPAKGRPTEGLRAEATVPWEPPSTSSAGWPFCPSSSSSRSKIPLTHSYHTSRFTNSLRSGTAHASTELVSTRDSHISLASVSAMGYCASIRHILVPPPSSNHLRLRLTTHCVSQWAPLSLIVGQCADSTPPADATTLLLILSAAVHENLLRH